MQQQLYGLDEALAQMRASAIEKMEDLMTVYGLTAAAVLDHHKKHAC